MAIHRRPFTAIALSAVIILAMGSPAVRAYASSRRAPDLFTQQGIDDYLTSHGINPRTAIEQTGLLNYVGTACPGKQWHCLAPTHRPVVQVAPRGGVNVYRCSVRPGRDGGCFVVQVNAGAPAGGASRTAKAKKGDPPPGSNEYFCAQYASGDTADLDASGCAVNQTNTTGDNDGVVLQGTRQTSTDSQSAAETAGTTGSPISQTNDSGKNQIFIGQGSQQKNSDTPTAGQTIAVSQVNGTGQNQAKLVQAVQQKVGDGAAGQDQEGSQFACLTQDSPSGQNQATVSQWMNQDEKDAAPATQAQNQTAGDGVPNSFCGEDEVFDYPNQAAVVLQDENTEAATGNNQETVKQELEDQEQSTAGSGPVSQFQGSWTSYGGFAGLDAIPDQDSTGVSHATTTQDEQQTMHANPATDPSQQQYDPIRQPPGNGVQQSNPSDTFELTQNSTQAAGSTATQIYDLIGDCISTGSCDVQQTATPNTGPVHNSCTASPCDNELTNNI